jgi:hypothetical protein
MSRTVYVAAVDAAAGVENVPAHDLGFERLEDVGDAQLLEARLQPFREEVRHHLFLGGADRSVALLLHRDRIGRAQLLFDQAEHFLLDRAVVDGLDLERFLRGLFGKIDDRVDHRLEVTVTEHHRAQHDLLVELLGFGFDHQHGISGAGDNEIELGLGHLVQRRVQNIFVIDEADAGRADRALEGHAR